MSVVWIEKLVTDVHQGIIEATQYDYGDVVTLRYEDDNYCSFIVDFQRRGSTCFYVDVGMDGDTKYDYSVTIPVAKDYLVEWLVDNDDFVYGLAVAIRGVMISRSSLKYTKDALLVLESKYS